MADEFLSGDTVITSVNSKGILHVETQSIHLLLYVTILFAFALYLASLKNVQVGVSDDDAHYIVASEALAGGYGYVLINYPIPRKEILWPPGYPIFLIPFTTWYLGQYTILQVMSIVLTIIWLSLSFLWFRRTSGALIASLSFLLVAFNPQIVGVATQVKSEALFLVLLFSTFLFLEKGISTDDKPWVIWLLLAVFCAVLATAVRSIGLVIILTIPIVAILFRRWRRTLITIAFILLTYLPLAMFLIQNGGTFIAPTRANQSQIFWTSNPIELIQHAVANLQIYAVKFLLPVLTAVFGPNGLALAERNQVFNLFLMGINLLLIGLVILGVYQFIKVGVNGQNRLNTIITIVFSSLYLGVLLIFRDGNVRGYHAQIRYLIPLLPFLMTWMLWGVLTVLLTVPWPAQISKFTRHTGISLSLIVLLFLSAYIGRDFLNIYKPNQSQIPDISAGADWIKEMTPQSAIIACDDPVPRYLYLDRKTVRYQTADTVEKTFSEFEMQPDYLLIAPRLRVGNEGRLDSDQEELIDLLQSRPKYELVHKNEDLNVYIFEDTRKNEQIEFYHP